MILSRIRKKLGWYDLRKECSKWVKKNLGAEYVQEFCEKYDKINCGIPIGGFNETVAFLDMVSRIKQEI